MRTVGVRPGLWPTALRQVVRLAPRGWWRRAPFLPRPDGPWTAFRLQTMYGDAGHALEPADLVAWLGWARRAGGRRNRAASPGPQG